MGNREKGQADQPDNEIKRGLYYDKGEDLDPDADPQVGGGTNRAMW